MELKQLQSFCAVVKYNSFTKAAESLFLSQPTISSHIRQLEEEFQSQLIIRTTKSIEITPRGRQLYECGLNMVHLQDNLMRSWSEEDQNVIHIGASTIPSAYILPEILPAFRRKNPDMQFHVSQGDSQAIVEGLLCGAYDMGLIGADTHEEYIITTPFYQDHMVVITPNNKTYRRYVENGGMTLQEICSHSMLLREMGSGSKKSITAYFEENNVSESDLTVAARLNDQESIKNLVSSGLGISIVSEKAVEEAVSAGRLLSFPLPGKGINRQLYIAVRQGAFLSTQTQKFISFIGGFYQK